MRSALLMLVALAFGAALVVSSQAQDKDKGKDNEVTLKGTVLCAKCALGEAKVCTTAIVVKEGGKDVTYLLKDKGDKEGYHDAVCGGAKNEGTVTGVVSTQDGKKWIAPKKVEYAKK